MADKKISALPAATTPLAGTEVLPIVQSGTTDQVSVANLTAGRDVSAKTLTGQSNGVGSQSEVIARNTAGAERIHLLSRSEAGVSYVQVQNAQMIVGTLDNFNAQIRTNNTQRMLFDTSGNVTVSNGNLVIGTAGKGIDFSANTSAAGMTSELLNWYEEGTFDAQITDGTNNATMNAKTCRYTRIGRMVYISGNVSTTSVAGLAGQIFLSNLPFTIGNGTAGSIGFASGLDIPAGYSVTINGNSGNTRVALQVWDVTTGTTAITIAEWSDDGNINFSLSYSV